MLSSCKESCASNSMREGLRPLSGTAVALQGSACSSISIVTHSCPSCAGGYYATTGNDPSILLRMKEDYDGAEPAASSYALSNLLRLAALAGPEDAQVPIDHHISPMHLRQYLSSTKCALASCTLALMTVQEQALCSRASSGVHVPLNTREKHIRNTQRRL